METSDYKKRRIELKLSQEDVAREAGISLYTYQLIERGSTMAPREETKQAIEKALGESC